MTPPDTALIEAVHTDNVEGVRNAIAIGANVNVPDPRPLVGARNTPLHDAANRGNSEIVALSWPMALTSTHDASMAGPR